MITMSLVFESSWSLEISSIDNISYHRARITTISFFSHDTARKRMALVQSNATKCRARDLYRSIKLAIRRYKPPSGASIAAASGPRCESIMWLSRALTASSQKLCSAHIHIHIRYQTRAQTLDFRSVTTSIIKASSAYKIQRNQDAGKSHDAVQTGPSSAASES